MIKKRPSVTDGVPISCKPLTDSTSAQRGFVASSHRAGA